jgi:hypothetical protein
MSGSGRVRHVMTRAFLFLCIGAGLTVVVSCSLAAFGRVWEVPVNHRADLRWMVEVAGWRGRPDVSSEARGFGVRWRATDYVGLHSWPAGWWWSERAELGWPVAAMSWSRAVENPSGFAKGDQCVYSDGLELPATLGSMGDAGWRRSIRRFVPLRPLPLRFVASSILYGSMVGVFVVGIPRWIRRRRRAKGLCLACGYDTSGLLEPRCPECGAMRG